MRNKRETGFLSRLSVKKIGIAGLLALLMACGGGSDPVPSFLVGGTVSGLGGSGLILQNSGANDLSITADGTFTFTSRVTNGGAYSVTVRTQPSGPSQTCTVAGGTGTVSGGDVTGVSVTCSPNTYAVRASVSGLSGSGFVLQNNAGDDLAIAADGTHAFATPVASGASYAVTVRTQPSGPLQTCTVTSGTGTVSASDVTVSIQCAAAYVLPTTATDVILGAGSVLVDGNRAYITAGTDFRVVDVTNPLSPSVLGTVTHGFTDLRIEAQAIHNNIVWCTRSSSGGMGLATHVFGVDVSDPANPVVRGGLTLQAATSLLSTSSLIYSGYWLVHDYSDNLIYIIDISDPDAPSVYNQWAVPNMVSGGPGHMMIDGTLLYLPCGENRTLRIYNLANLAAVSEVGSVSTVNEAYGNAVKIGSYVYVVAGTTLRVFDVSNPAAPAYRGNVAVSNWAIIRGKNGKLFLFEGGTPTVRVYSLANPEVPVVEASSTVSFSGPTGALGITPLSWVSSEWVGNYLVGMTYGSAAAYSGARALDFTVN